MLAYCQSWEPHGFCVTLAIVPCLPLLSVKQRQVISSPGWQRAREAGAVCLPGNEDAEQIHLIRSCQEHDDTESQLQEEESSHHSINPAAAAEGQEVEVVEMGGNVGNT